VGINTSKNTAAQSVYRQYKTGAQSKTEIANPDIAIHTFASDPIAPITLAQVQHTATVRINLSKYKSNFKIFDNIARKINNCNGLLTQGREVFTRIDPKHSRPGELVSFGIEDSKRHMIQKKYDQDLITVREKNKFIGQETVNELKDPFYEKTLQLIAQYNKPLEGYDKRSKTDPRSKFVTNMYIELLTTMGIYMNHIRGDETLSKSEQDALAIKFMNSDKLLYGLMSFKEIETLFIGMTEKYDDRFLAKLTQTNYLLGITLAAYANEMKDTIKTPKDLKDYEIKMNRFIDEIAHQFITNTIPISPKLEKIIEAMITDAFNETGIKNINIQFF